MRRAVPQFPSAPLLVVAAPLRAAAIVSRLQAADLPVLAVTSLPAACAVLQRIRPCALLTAVRIGAHNGVHVAHAAQRFHEALPKIVIGEADPVLEAETERAGAQYLVEPLDPAALIALAGRLLIEGAAPRRWRRLRLPWPVPALVNGRASRIVDVGYGGIGLEVLSGEAGLPSALDVFLPDQRLTLATERVWQHRSGGTLRCGALLTDAAAATAAEWRAFVNQYRLEEWRRLGES